MNRKLISIMCTAAIAGSLLAAAPVFAESQTEASTEASGSAPTAEELLAEKVTPDKAYKFALITMDSIDQHWVNMNNGAQEEAKADGVTVDFMSPDTKDDAKQIEMVNNATAAGYDAIMIAANGPDAITGALKDAQAAGIKIVYVDSPANLDAEATFSTDNKAAGKTAGEQMIAALKDKGITKGDIGIVNVNADLSEGTMKLEFAEATVILDDPDTPEDVIIGNVITTLNLTGQDSSSFTLPEGDYAMLVTAQGKTKGTVKIEVVKP